MGIIIDGNINVGSSGISISPIYVEPPYTGPICISGAGSTQVNGTYTFTGYVADGSIVRPEYYKTTSDFVITLAGNGKYTIRVAGGDQNGQYIGNTFPAPAYPYLETSWSLIEDGVLPYPVITRGSC
jgi:hypothetical protein